MAEWVQFAIVLVVVAAAATYLALRALKLFRRKRGCGSGCSGCSRSEAAPGGSSLIQLESLSEPARR